MANTITKETRLEPGFFTGFIRKLSRGLMLPIAMLPIAGLFLGVGAGFSNLTKTIMDGASDMEIAQATFVFDAISKIGDMIFGNLPTLFCLGVAIAFAEEAGVAVFAAFVGWIVFNATQSTMIWEQADGTYNIFWYTGIPNSVIGSNIGITSMQTSVFGGITVGLFVAFLYNKFHTYEMPVVLGFFSGTRLVPILAFLMVPLLGVFFLMVWPVIGIMLEEFGSALMGLPFGTDAFIFGVVERSLIPFGLHHAFYTPLWYTSVGGQLLAVNNIDGFQAGQIIAVGDQGIFFSMQDQGIPFTVLGEGLIGNKGLDGWTLESGAGLMAGSVDLTGYNIITNTATDQQWAITEGANPGQYQQGKFTFMMFGLPAAGAAMIMAARKENRQVALSIIGASALTAALTGITEPIEFTFLFLAPYLYYGFHIWMAGLSFFLLDVLGAHIGMTFSGGIFDYLIFGILPDATGFHTNSWIVIILGLFIYAPVYYLFFYFMITKLDIQTPGREEGAEVVMKSKADFQEAKKAGKSSGSNDAEWLALVDDLEEKLGGLDNLAAISACITKLRLTVKDPAILEGNSEEFQRIGKEIKQPGILVGGKGSKSKMIVFGVYADKFKAELLKRVKEAGSSVDEPEVKD